MVEAVPGGTESGGREQRFALGIGLTNECNLACAFCYRDPPRVDRLDLEQVRAVLDRLPVRSVNLGTGENGMHPQFREMLALLRSRNVKLTMTSNGLSVAVLTSGSTSASRCGPTPSPSPTRSTGSRSSCCSRRPTSSRWGSRWCGRCSGCREVRVDAGWGRSGSRPGPRFSPACTGPAPATRCRCSSRWARRWCRRPRSAPSGHCLLPASHASSAKPAAEGAPDAVASTGRWINPIATAPSCAGSDLGCRCGSRRAEISRKPGAPAPRWSWHARRR